MSVYIDKAIEEAKRTNKFVVVCIEGVFGKSLLSNDDVFRALALNFVPYTTSSGSDGCKNFCNIFAVTADKQRYLIINPTDSKIVEQTEQQNMSRDDLLRWLQEFLDKSQKETTSTDSNNNKKGKNSKGIKNAAKEHQVGQRFPKPKQKDLKNCKKNEFHLTPQTQYEEVKNINVKMVDPDGNMHTGRVNKDKKISQWLRPLCKELNFDINKLAFNFDGRPFDVEKTVKNIHIQENGVVYANYKA